MIRRLVLAAAALAALAGAGYAATAPADDDPYLWLADIHGAKALEWVKQQNALSDALKADPNYDATRKTILASLNAPGRIAEPQLKGDYVLNFWQDKEHVRGLWRRATVASYNSGQPDWQTLLDVDALDRESGQPFVWKGADCTEDFSRCLVRLSPGGGDALVIREFDPKAGKFLEGGFELPLAKSSAEYLGPDSVLFDTDFGPGTLTKSSYPRIVKLWHRGQPVDRAKTLFEASANDMGANARVFHGAYGTVALIVRRPSFFKADYYAIDAHGKMQAVDVPQDAELAGVTAGQLLFVLRDAWKMKNGRQIPQGALIAVPAPGFEGKAKNAGRPTAIFAPAKGETLEAFGAGHDIVYASVFKDVIGQVRAFRYAKGTWTSQTLDLPAGGSTNLVSVSRDGTQAYIQFESFTQAPTLYFDDGSHHVRQVYALPALYDASKVDVAQHWITSKDGTKVPYFLVRPKGAAGPLPTIEYGYGGFELSLFPWYWDDSHRPLDALQAWVAKGGAIAVANIRGGGEFGPAWHEAALKFHRQRAYDDFEGVAEDIESHNWSTPKMLGIVGASNGGLLVSTVMVQRPDLFAAVVCQRPLIDMIRYTHYGAGASWAAEYGDPADPKMREYILSYSPYQNVKPGVTYPSVLFVTETTDDRVTPIFARMMAAKMLGQGHKNVLFTEAAEGGHGAGSTHEEEADYWALSYTFFQKELGLK